ncbi:MAG: hypothetical protein COA79_01640 [Planctomycetota bacterium]|nr:MAG: hypothetical protein COA79_01640 [Planctomycetota bacterium]
MKNKILAGIILLGVLFIGYKIKTMFFKSNISYNMYMDELEQSANWFKEKDILKIVTNEMTLTPRVVEVFENKEMEITSITNIAGSNPEDPPQQYNPEKKVSEIYAELKKSRIKGLYIDIEIDLTKHSKYLNQYLESGGSVFIRSFYNLTNITKENSAFIFKYLEKESLSMLDEDSNYYSNEDIEKLRKKVKETSTP